MKLTHIFTSCTVLTITLVLAQISPVAVHASSSWYRPTPDVTWQWQLSGVIDQNYNVNIYDIDLFDTPVKTIASLQSKGKKVICYFSAGSSENWRSDFARFDRSTLGKKNGWEGERWLDIRTDNALDVMLERLNLAVKKGCDGVEPDNVDGYLNKTGFPLTVKDQITFNRRIAEEAHRRGLAVALKNTGDLANELVDYFDLAINEECHAYRECDQLAVFTKQGKPILNAEYKKTKNLCALALSKNMRTLLLPRKLNNKSRMSCDELNI